MAKRQSRKIPVRVSKVDTQKRERTQEVIRFAVSHLKRNSHSVYKLASMLLITDFQARLVLKILELKKVAKCVSASEDPKKEVWSLVSRRHERKGDR